MNFLCCPCEFIIIDCIRLFDLGHISRFSIGHLSTPGGKFLGILLTYASVEVFLLHTDNIACTTCGPHLHFPFNGRQCS